MLLFSGTFINIVICFLFIILIFINIKSVQIALIGSAL